MEEAISNLGLGLEQLTSMVQTHTPWVLIAVIHITGKVQMCQVMNTHTFDPSLPPPHQ
jgi:hypothetical protein